MKYESPEITHCILGPVLCKESLCGPIPIILKLETEVVIYSTEIDGIPPGVGVLTPTDIHGVRLVSVPHEYIDRFLTSVEASLLESVTA